VRREAILIRGSAEGGSKVSYEVNPSLVVDPIAVKRRGFENEDLIIIIDYAEKYIYIPGRHVTEMLIADEQLVCVWCYCFYHHASLSVLGENFCYAFLVFRATFSQSVEVKVFRKA
jgi:hypothetical protein